MCVSGGTKYLFFWKVIVCCFLETPVLRFALLPYFRQYEGELFYLRLAPGCILQVRLLNYISMKPYNKRCKFISCNMNMHAITF